MNGRSFSEGDLDQLEQYVNAPQRAEAALPLDAIQGLVAAIASGPSPIPTSRWIPAALGESHEFETPDDEARITALLSRFRDDVARQLNEGEGFDFILYGPEGEDEDFSVWADGYLAGVDLADPPWDEAAGADDLDSILFPFLAMTGQAKEIALENGEGWMDEAQERRMMKEIHDAFADHVLEVRRFWFDKSVPPTVKRDAAKTGRNEPCPCGSGKKFKSCCGG